MCFELDASSEVGEGKCKKAKVRALAHRNAAAGERLYRLDRACFSNKQRREGAR